MTNLTRIVWQLVDNMIQQMKRGDNDKCFKSMGNVLPIKRNQIKVEENHENVIK